MEPRIAAAVFVSAALIASSAWGACSPQSNKSRLDKPHHAKNCVDLGAVPQIGAQIVAREPTPAKPRGYQPPSEKRYEGPTVGLTKLEPGVRPAPTVGYKWNLE